MQLDWMRVPQARSRGCKTSVTITNECLQHLTVMLSDKNNCLSNGCATSKLTTQQNTIIFSYFASAVTTEFS